MFWQFACSKYLFFILIWRNLLDGPQRDYPNDNYLSGDGKSAIWKGHAFYAPHNRSWRDLHEVKALPWDRVPGLIEFQSEDEWREWQKKRDTPGSGKFCASSGILPLMSSLKCIIIAFYKYIKQLYLTVYLHIYSIKNNYNTTRSLLCNSWDDYRLLWII